MTVQSEGGARGQQFACASFLTIGATLLLACHYHYNGFILFDVPYPLQGRPTDRSV